MLPSRQTTGSRRRRACATLVLIMSVTLTGCSTVRMPDLDNSVPAHWRNAATSAAPKPDLHGWWHRFHDPQLDGIVDQALQDNLDVAIAVQRLRAVRILNRHARARFRPSLSVRTDDPIDPDASASFFVAGFDSLWEFGLFGRSQAYARQTQANVDLADTTLREARVSLVAEVVRNWIELRAAQQRLLLLTRIHAARTHSLELLQVRTRLHLNDPAQSAQQQAAVATADAAMSEPRIAINTAAQHLALLLGKNEPDPSWLQPAALPGLGKPALTSVPADLLRTRPEIAHAQAQVLLSAGKLGLARADEYPSIGLGGSIDWSTSTLSHRDAPTNRIASFGPVIDIPLFDWGLRQARAHASAHELKASVLAYRKAVLTGVAEVETALGNLAEQRLRERASARAWQALRHAANQQTTRQRLGLADGMNIADAGVASAKAGLDTVAARADRDLAYVALYKALGGAPQPKVHVDADSRARNKR